MIILTKPVKSIGICFGLSSRNEASFWLNRSNRWTSRILTTKSTQNWFLSNKHILIKLSKTIYLKSKTQYVLYFIAYENSQRCWQTICLNGYIAFGDGCWRKNVLMTTLRCWWPVWLFLPPTCTLDVSDQNSKDVIKIEILTPTSGNCHQLQVTTITVTMIIKRFPKTKYVCDKITS